MPGYSAEEDPLGTMMPPSTPIIVGKNFTWPKGIMKRWGNL